MVETIEFTETKIHYKKGFRNADFEVRSTLDAISHTACTMAIDVDAKCIIVNSLSGKTARMVSRFRCPVDIIGMTTSAKVWRKLNLSWGLTPVMCGMYDTMEEMFRNSVLEATEALGLKKGDNVVITGGALNGNSGNTNLIQVETIERGIYD
jgi:pyruvate kinase